MRGRFFRKLCILQLFVPQLFRGFIHDEFVFVIDSRYELRRRRNSHRRRCRLELHDRRRRTQREFAARAVPELRQATLDDTQNFIARRRCVFAQAFEVVVDTADRIGKRVERRPIGSVAGNEFITDVKTAATELFGRRGKRHHCERALDRRQQRRNVRQTIGIPLRRYIVDDSLLHLLDTGAGFTQHGHLRFVDQARRIRRSAQTAALLCDAGEVLIDLQQRGRDAEQ